MRVERRKVTPLELSLLLPPVLLLALVVACWSVLGDFVESVCLEGAAAAAVMLEEDSNLVKMSSESSVFSGSDSSFLWPRFVDLRERVTRFGARVFFLRFGVGGLGEVFSGTLWW